MTNISQNRDSQDVLEVTKMINELAVDVMFKQYDCLSPDMKIRLSNVTKQTQQILDEDADLK